MTKQNKIYINWEKIKIECNGDDFQWLLYKFWFVISIHLCHMEASNFQVNCHILQPNILDACHFVSGVCSIFLRNP